VTVVTTYRSGGVLVVVSDNPPVNALGALVRQGLSDAITEALNDHEIEAVVIRAEGRTFFAGADITEFGKPPMRPSLAEVIDQLEQLGKPTVAAIHGTALGGGLEVALACNYRLAVSSSKMGLPEVKLGLLPGAGGTQRLPRIIGTEAALNMIIFGNPISAQQASDLGLVDQIVEEDNLEAAAIAFAHAVAAKTIHPISSERTDRIFGTAPAIIDEFRKTNSRRLRGAEAPEACLEAVKAAITRPYSEGVEVERKLFQKLVNGAQSAALRHIFFAERQAAKIDDIPADLSLLPIRKIGIIGAGTMGGGIAMNFLSAGYDVVIAERERTALDRGIDIIRNNYDTTMRKGRLSSKQVEEAMGHLTGSLDYAEFADCDLVIEAVFELMEIKKDVFRKLDQICKPGAILATNTSYLNIDEIAAATTRPEWVVGLHFFSPANVMRLLEVVRGERISSLVLATVMSMARKIGKVAVVAGVCHGFIGNRMLASRQAQAAALLLEGALPDQVDRVLVDFGFPMGPFQMSDLAGLDLGWRKEESKGETIREILCERGRRGQKTGKGYYDYDQNRHRTPSEEVNEIVREFARRSGQPQREISNQEILERLLYPLVNEGAAILEEGIAQRPSDIDTVWVNGYGWPAYTGGPMYWADQIGIANVLAGLEKHARSLKGQPISKLLREKATGGRFHNEQ
jgi:3-hydroxyacyl-CoA dehydrogenase